MTAPRAPLTLSDEQINHIERDFDGNLMPTPGDRGALSRICAQARYANALAEAITNMLNALEAEAKAKLSANNAMANFSVPGEEIAAYEKAMIAASQASWGVTRLLAARSNQRGDTDE